MKKHSPPQALSEKPYRHIAFTPVSSNQVQAIGYPPDTKTLAVTFTRCPGNMYHYPNVSQETYEAFISAEPIGKYFGKHIKELPFEKYPAPVSDLTTPAGIAEELSGKENQQ